MGTEFRKSDILFYYTRRAIFNEYMQYLILNYSSIVNSHMNHVHYSTEETERNKPERMKHVIR